jgi:hypothetical protein
MDFCDSNKSSIGFGLNIRMNVGFRFLKKPEIMAFTITKSCTNYFAGLFVNDNLCLEGMTFFLARIILFLLVFAAF